MGTGFEAAIALDTAYVMQTYARRPVLFVSGSGMRLYDDEGREYLDFVSGIGAVNLGHAHPAITRAICVQASRLVHVSNLYYTEHRGELAEKIATLLEGQKAGAASPVPNAASAPTGWRLFFANSGTEATEGAVKLARRWASTHKPGAYVVVTAERSFHGRTLAALAATVQPSKQEAFEPLPAGFVHVPLNDIEALDAMVDETVAAVFLEVVQGEGGVWPCTAEYLEAARRICDGRHCLLMIDEVQTGFFRTGPAFAFQGMAIVPDVVTLAKGMANGVPIGAVAARGSAAVALKPGDHGSTFGGGPLATAAGLATVDALVEEGVGENAMAVGDYLRAGLSEIADRTGSIADVRGRGLMVGISLKEPIAGDLVTTALEKGVVLNNIGTDIVRFLPPLVCTRADVDTLLAVLSDILSGGVQ
jgi:acetylornithine/N-succinyldiaminopimelate aminotransferase